MHPKACDLTVNLPLKSLSNYPHMVLFCIFFVVTTLHFRLSGWQPLAWSIGLTVAMGAGMEIAHCLSGTHHCKAIDLTPDFIGAVLGSLIVVLGRIIANAKLAHRYGDNGPIRGNQTAN
jgi:VanZ family protein